MNSVSDSSTLLLFGASGHLGTALRRRFSAARSLLSIPWKTIGPRLEDLASLNSLLDHPGHIDVVFASGVTDPSMGEAVLHRSNVLLVQSVVSALGSADARFLTIGTIQENDPDQCRANPYLESKLELGQWVKASAGEPGKGHRFRHVRLHTLYGGPPKPHMFLGQMATALRSGSPFLMSDGDQLREYHHVDDVAAGISALLRRDWEALDDPILEINSGHPIHLADLARQVFAAFGAEHLLNIGALPRPSRENTRQVYPASPRWLLPSSRDPVQGVIQTLKAWGVRDLR